nr:hypothetical protein [Tanacetum cinerariifolium]
SYALGEYIYLLLYVDDMLIACKSKAEILSTKSLLKREFDMKDLREAKKILGMEIVRDWSHKILRVSQSRNCDVERMSKVSYANAVGSLMNLMVCTRPDIAYAISIVSRYLANPGFVDSDYVKDPDKEAKYMALTEAVKEAIWLKGLLEELGVELNRVTVNCDNQGAFYLSRNHVFHERTKHINSPSWILLPPLISIKGGEGEGTMYFILSNTNQFDMSVPTLAPDLIKDLQSARLYDVIMIIIRGRSLKSRGSGGSAPGSRVQGAAAPGRVQGAEPLAPDLSSSTPAKKRRRFTPTLLVREKLSTGTPCI